MLERSILRDDLYRLTLSVSCRCRTHFSKLDLSVFLREKRSKFFKKFNENDFTKGSPKNHTGSAVIYSKVIVLYFQMYSNEMSSKYSFR
jgi:hypothetical protein